MMKPGSWIKGELESIDNKNLRRSLKKLGGPQGGRIELDGAPVINLCSNDYLGLASHPLLKEAAADAVKKFGCGSGSSRLISGNALLYGELEERLAAFTGRESALVFGSGYAANTGAIPALAGKSGVIYSDEFNHASIIDGTRLSGATVKIYRHCDPADLTSNLEPGNGPGRKLLITESLFSMDGDIAPVDELGKIARGNGLMMLVDEAHGMGVIGEGGRGVCAGPACKDDITAVMGTFGKAFGSYGAFIAGSRELVEYLANRARTFIFSTALPPSVLAATIAAVKLVESDGSMRGRLFENISFFTKELHCAGFDIGASRSQIIPIVIGDNKKTMDFCKALLEAGVYIQGIRPPTVPEGTSRLRISLSASHSTDDLARALEALIITGKKFGILNDR